MKPHRRTTRNVKFDKLIGERIRNVRESRGMTQLELAIKLRVTWQQVQKYENGTNALPSTRVPDLCKGLRLTPNELFDI